jgi:transposase
MQENSTATVEVQAYYLGIDVHKRNWVVTIRSSGLQLKTISISAGVQELWSYLQSHYPSGVYYSVYEAGFSGFSTHQQLEAVGIHNIVVHPADVPSSQKEKHQKTDAIDSRKLARELEHHRLRGIYVPDSQSEQFRSLVRMRHNCVKQQTRIKNQIKSLLYQYGLQEIIPQNNCNGHWSARFIAQVASQQQHLCAPGAQTMQLLLQQLSVYRQQVLDSTQSLRKLVSEHPAMAAQISLLQSVPGIGFVSAVTLQSELITMDRFRSVDQLNSFVGLVPSVRSSGDRHSVGGLSYRCNSRLRRMLVEASWIAVRRDAALLQSYKALTGRMKPQQAIIRIARKLLSRLRSVWLHHQPYRTLQGVIANGSANATE